MTWVDVRWMLVHTTSALPYVAIMIYLVWVHIRAIRRAARVELGATLTALVLTLLAAGVFVFNQPPFRFMVTPETNALVKDVVLVLQALLVTVFADQVRDRTMMKQWLLRTAAGLVPLAHTVYFYAAGLTLQEDVIHVPWTLTLFSASSYAYAAVNFAQEYRQSRLFPVRWRLGTMVAGLAAGILYVSGRGVMGFVPIAFLRGDQLVWGVAVGGLLVWVNRLALTLTTLCVTLGMAMPDWYRKLGAWWHILSRAGDHFDHLISLLGRISDQEIKLKDDGRLAVRTVAAWLANGHGLSLESRKVVQHLAMLTPIEGVAADRPLPPEMLDAEDKLDLAASVGVFSSVYQAIEGGDKSIAGHREAQLVQAARFYVEGRTMQEIATLCPGKAAAMLSMLHARRAGAV